jgi:hypothetical protein
MLKRLLMSVLALTVLAGASTTTIGPADARSRVGVGIAAGIIAGTALGAYAYGYPRYYGPRTYSYASSPECYQGPRQCSWHGRSCWFNRWGEQVCNRGEYRCWRPTVCD